MTRPKSLTRRIYYCALGKVYIESARINTHKKHCKGTQHIETNIVATRYEEFLLRKNTLEKKHKREKFIVFKNHIGPR